MQYSRYGLALTEQFEGCRLTAYRDQGGVLTIGFGHTDGVTAGQTITLDQAAAFLAEDIQRSVDDVNRLVLVELTQGEFDALVDFDFNLGRGALAGSTMLKLINQCKFEKAAAEFDKWDHCHGQVVAGLLRRREAERGEFTDKYTV